MQPELISVADAAKMIGLGETKTKELVRAEVLRSTKIGRRRLIYVNSIRQFAGILEAA